MLAKSEWKKVYSWREMIESLEQVEEMVRVHGINAADVSLLAPAWKENTTLLWLSLYGKEMGPKGALTFFDTLRGISTVLYLGLWGVDMRTKGCRSLSYVLQENSTLRFLHLGYCQIDLQGIQYLSEGLRQNFSLLYLDLSNSRVENEGLRFISKALEDNRSLLYLRLSGCGIGPKGAQYLSDMLNVNSTLLFLCLRVNKIAVKGAEYLSQGLRKNKSLLYLDLVYNHIGFEGVQLLAEKLQYNTEWLYIDIDGGCLYECEKESTSILQQSDMNLSFNECQHYLRALYQVSSWVSFRNEPLSSVHNDLPTQMWGEIVSFLSNDFSSLLESFLVYDLRSGYIAPFAHTFCSARNAWLLSLLPYIEGHFRCDTWTMGRLLYITD